MAYRPDAEEQLLGELFAAEAGLEVERGEEWFVAARTETPVREALVAAVENAVADAV